MFANGEREVPVPCFRQEFSLQVPARVSSTDCRTSPPRCVRISFSSILIASEIAFFIFLRYIFHGLFFLSFDYGLVTIINQETGSFQELSFKMCAIFRTLSFFGGGITKQLGKYTERTPSIHRLTINRIRMVFP